MILLQFHPDIAALKIATTFNPKQLKSSGDMPQESLCTFHNNRNHFWPSKCALIYPNLSGNPFLKNPVHAHSWKKKVSVEKDD